MRGRMGALSPRAFLEQIIRERLPITTVGRRLGMGEGQSSLS